MAIRVLINGSDGRMGQQVVKSIINEHDLELVGSLGRGNNLAEEIKKTKAEVVIDFTRPDVVFKNTQTILEAGARPVIGTTGLLQSQIKQLEQECSKLQRGGIIAPNFSLGAVLMMKYAQEIAKYFPQVEIIEMHHDGKLDSPSGTAILSAELIAAARGGMAKKVPIHSVRLKGLVAHQQIIFGGVGETLTIKHDSIDRECFMPGVMLACRKVMELDYLVYGLEHLM